MFKVGELVVYGGEGVCRIEAIGSPSIPAVDPDRLYYTLAPLYREGRTYTPVDTNILMRAVITRDEAKELIRQIPSIEPNEYSDRNPRELTEQYKESLQSRCCTELVQLIKAVYVKREDAAEKKKKLGAVDERYMQRAEEMLHGELAVALDIPVDEVRDYIAQCIEEAGAESQPVGEGLRFAGISQDSLS